MPAKPKTVKSPRGTKQEKGKVAAAKATPKQSAAKEEGPRQAKYDAFAQSQDVVWRLTKKFNCNLVKFNGNQWSKSPFSLSGFHNASESANTLGVTGIKEKTDKDTVKRVFALTLKHKRVNGISKRKAASQRKPAYSVHEVRNEVNHAAKTIKNLTWQNDKCKKLALRRLARASWSMQPSLKAAAKSE